MATVTIGKTYLDALLRRAQFHTSEHEFELAPDLLSGVYVSKAEYDSLQQCRREYALLKSALFRGGLAVETLSMLLTGESEAANDDSTQYEHEAKETFAKSKTVSTTMQETNNNVSTPNSDDTETVSDHLDLPQRRPLHRVYSNDQTECCVDNDSEEETDHWPERRRRDRIPRQDQRTVLISNLAERTTHKDIAGVICGGRLLEIFLRSDRSATVSFVEGAADFLAYTKRNDIYLHAKRLEIRWADRQFNVSPHVASKNAMGVSRNLIVRGVAGRVTEGQIRDHLDHIHNLVVVDVYFQNGDAHISTNSIHNALFARTCMLSRGTYKGTRIDWAPDGCAVPLPQPDAKVRLPVMRVPPRPLPVTNIYTLLDTDSAAESDSRIEGYHPADGRLEHKGLVNTALV